MKEEIKGHLNRHAGDLLVKHWHHAPRNFVRGCELETGDVLEAGDLYESTSGSWVECPCPGLTLQAGDAVTWVRPERTGAVGRTEESNVD